MNFKLCPKTSLFLISLKCPWLKIKQGLDDKQKDGKRCDGLVISNIVYNVVQKFLNWIYPKSNCNDKLCTGSGCCLYVFSFLVLLLPLCVPLLPSTCLCYLIYNICSLRVLLQHRLRTKQRHTLYIPLFCEYRKKV